MKGMDAITLFVRGWPADLHKAVKMAALEEDKTVREWLVEVVMQALAEKEARK